MWYSYCGIWPLNKDGFVEETEVEECSLPLQFQLIQFFQTFMFKIQLFFYLHPNYKTELFGGPL